MKIEPSGAKFKRWKTVHAIDHMVTVVGFIGDESVLRFSINEVA
jgi:hypothetical protein